MESVSLPSIVLSPPNSRLQIGFKPISNCTVVQLRKETVLACKTIWRCGVYCKCRSHAILEHFFVITMIPLCSSMSMTCWSAKRTLRILHSVKVLVVLNRLVDNAFFTSVRDDTLQCSNLVDQPGISHRFWSSPYWLIKSKVEPSIFRDQPLVAASSEAVNDKGWVVVCPVIRWWKSAHFLHGFSLIIPQRKTNHRYVLPRYVKMFVAEIPSLLYPKMGYTERGKTVMLCSQTSAFWSCPKIVRHVFWGGNWFDQVKKEIQPSSYPSCGYDVTFGNLNIAMENYIFW